MNLPNKLTLLRVIMIPAIVVLLLAFQSDGTCIAAGALFILASLTDLLDGKIARKYHLVTNFGKFMDPLADKLLVCSILICCTALDLTPAWAVIIVIAREFAISGFRLVAVEKGVVIAADWSGKVKTTLQDFWCIGMLFPFPWTWWKVLTNLMMIGAVVLTVYSFAEYLIKNRSVLSDDQ